MVSVLEEDEALEVWILAAATQLVCPTKVAVGQGKHVLRPVPSWYVETAHKAQMEEPVVAAKLPAAHDKTDDAPCVSTYEPVAARVQLYNNNRE